jgi:hypothetical protein
MSATPPPLGFVSYSHHDKEWLDRFKRFFKTLARHGDLEVWDDGSIRHGERWYDRIRVQMARAKVAILLVTQDFLDSDFCMQDEVPYLLEREEAGGLLLVPILIKECLWQREPLLKTRQLTTVDGEAVEACERVDAALTQIFKDLAETLDARKAGKLIANEAGTWEWPTDRYDIARLPGSGKELFGRRDDLIFLDQAWASPTTHVVSLVAWGGVGKSALVNRWLADLAKTKWGGAERVFGWSFYSQGSHENTVSSADQFIDQALKWFGDPNPAAGSPWDKGERLAGLVRQQKTLLLLDGLEPLQWGTGDRGRIKDPALATLVSELAGDNRGLVVITTREPVTDLAEFPDTAHSHDLHRLSPGAGRALLRVRGARGTDAELEAMSAAFGNHALAVALLAAWLRKAPLPHTQAVRAIPTLPGIPEREHHPRRVIAAFATRFGEGLERQILRLLGLFDRPADADGLKALVAAPPIPGLTVSGEVFATIKRAFLDWAAKLGLVPRAEDILRDAGLLHPPGLDAHPLVREHFATELRVHHPEAWRAGNDGLYRHLIDRPKKTLPDTLDEMQPLYLAIPHGCAAGHHQEVFDEVFWKRIRRDNKQHYSVNTLGAWGADLAALANFFESPWERPVAVLSAPDRGLLLNEAAYGLRALGRLAEAVAPIRAGLTVWSEREDWESAATGAGNLSEVLGTLGRLTDAEAAAGEAVALADSSTDIFLRMENRAIQADVRHQRGQFDAAAAGFAEAEGRQRKREPAFPRLYSHAGFRYCELLLSQRRFAEVRDRAGYALKIAEQYHWLLAIALDQLSLGCAHAAEAAAGNGDSAAAERVLDAAVLGLRRAGQQDYLPRGLLARAAFRRQRRAFKAARRDLDEARRIAARGGMRLHLIDADLEAARLALAETPSDAAGYRDRARAGIADTGYHRRDPELAELDRALGPP